jgi:hypothetical protein
MVRNRSTLHRVPIIINIRWLFRAIISLATEMMCCERRCHMLSVAYACDRCFWFGSSSSWNNKQIKELH